MSSLENNRALGVTFDEVRERFMSVNPGKKDWLLRYFENGLKLVEKDKIKENK